MARLWRPSPKSVRLQRRLLKKQRLKKPKLRKLLKTRLRKNQLSSFTFRGACASLRVACAYPVCRVTLRTGFCFAPVPRGRRKYSGSYDECLSLRSPPHHIRGDVVGRKNCSPPCPGYCSSPRRRDSTDDLSGAAARAHRLRPSRRPRHGDRAQRAPRRGTSHDFAQPRPRYPDRDSLTYSLRGHDFVIMTS